MSCNTENKAITIEELEVQLHEAKRGGVKVDKHYVGNASFMGHLFEYEYDYVRFLDNITHVIKEGKKRREENGKLETGESIWM